MIQLYRKTEDQDRYEPVNPPTREDLARWYEENEEVCGAAFAEDDPCYKHQEWCYSFADDMLRFLSDKFEEEQ